MTTYYFIDTTLTDKDTNSFSSNRIFKEKVEELGLMNVFQEPGPHTFFIPVDKGISVSRLTGQPEKFSKKSSIW